MTIIGVPALNMVESTEMISIMVNMMLLTAFMFVVALPLGVLTDIIGSKVATKPMKEPIVSTMQASYPSLSVYVR